MNKPHLYAVIEGAHISEKASRIADDSRQFTFKVAKVATKLQIRQAVEKLFDVRVQSVRTSTVKGKSKGFGRTSGKRPGWKKAYVTLQPGFDIDYTTAE